LNSAAALGQERFDVVVSLGVLHHLSDPREGFRQIRQIVSNDGLLLCYLYSSYGQREETAVKEFLNDAIGAKVSFVDRIRLVRKLGIDKRHTLRAFFCSIMNRLRFGPPLVVSELIKTQLSRNRFAGPSDTFSNPCEHLYAFREISQMCEQTGWEIAGLSEKGGLPTSPGDHTWNRARLDLLRELPADVLYDYFAFYYRASGFSFYAKPV
jgi:SAM-dependent methyltransferase